MDLVPFREKWAGSETKLDLKAWYRRESRHGGFSLVGPLPLRRHLDWTRKGCEYVALATVQDVALVVPSLQADGIDVSVFRKAYDRIGNFDIAAYLKAERVKDDAFITDLQAKVDKFGAETVTEMMRLSDAAFVMPDQIVIKAPAKKEAVK